MEELLDFITARLGEAEAIARAATPGAWEGDGGDGYVYAGHPTNEVTPYRTGTEDIAHIVLNQPAAVLRDVEATRRLLADLDAEHHHVSPDCWYTCPQATKEREGETTCNDNELGGPCNCGRDVRVLRRMYIIASRWSTHPAHSVEWKVED